VRAFGSAAELLADPGIDAVYIATPHTEHLRLAVEAAEAGKHVLCEKPLAVNHAGQGPAWRPLRTTVSFACSAGSRGVPAGSASLCSQRWRVSV
jgi:hypothetical protein